MKLRNASLGLGFWAFASAAAALSLGPARGTVFLGGQVDLTFEVQPDPGTDVSSSCIAAKVVSGDTPVNDAKVRVTPLPDQRGRQPAVRVLANVAVDEPMLLVTLSGGCTGRSTRTYTFLTEPPVTSQRAPIATLVTPPLVASGNASRDAPRGAAATQGGAGLPSGAAGIPAQPGAGAVARSRPETLGRSVRPRPSASAGDSSTPRAALAQRSPPRAPVAALRPTPQSRLVVEPLELWLDMPVPLRSTQELLSIPSEDASPARSQAALVWKSLNVVPADLQQDAERLDAMQADSAALRTKAATDQAAVAELRAQLQAAQDERFSASVVYALGGLLLASLLVALWLALRSRNSSEKAVVAWRESVALGAQTAPVLPAVAEIPASAASPVVAAVKPTVVQAARAPTVSSPPVFTPVQAPNVPIVHPPVPRAAPVAQQASPALQQLVNPEDLFDIQQQAEFFVSVGEHQQAIEVLKAHIGQHEQTSPLAYLELLNLFHTLSRVDEFVQLRAQFMQHFNALVPDFVVFHRKGRALDEYEDALAQIEAQWSSVSVLELLERMLFRSDASLSSEPFDLDAYDDLLLLLSIALTTPASARGAPPPRNRTTPVALERAPFASLPYSADPVHESDAYLDSLAASLEFDFELEPLNSAVEEGPVSGTPTVARTTPNAIKFDGDFDFSDPPPITTRELPPVPVTPPPVPGQAVGFGTDNDLVELGLELGQRKPADPR